MSDVKWTEAQQLAINERGTDLLVSAAAGSGKTAVLTERIIRELTDADNPVDVTDFLIVTFTVSATTELREKLSKAIRKAYNSDKSSKRLKRQILNIPFAKILTIDSFCKSVATECAKELNLPADFQTGEENELNILTAEAVSETLDMFFDGYEGEKLYDTSYLPNDVKRGFISVIEAFASQKSFTSLNETVIWFYNKLMKYPDPMLRARDYLSYYDSILRDHYANGSEKSFFDTKLGNFIVNDIKEGIGVALKFFKEAEMLLDGYEDMGAKYAPVIAADIAAMTRIMNADPSETVQALTEYSPLRLSSYRSKGDGDKEVQESFKKLRDAGKELASSLKSKYPITDENKLYMQIANTFSVANELLSVVSEFYKIQLKAKYEKKIFSFDDIAQFAYKALIKEESYNRITREFERTDYALELGEKFHEILIDEYQDVNELQDTIFRAVSNSHNRFMVGDLKQSIYKFRGATPEIFFHYRNTFSPIDSTDGSPRLVALQNNFRSDSSVIGFVNDLFDVIMNYRSDDVYRRDDYLVFSKSEDKEIPTEILITENKAEFDCVADRIIEIVKESEFNLRDICILARKHDSLREMQTVLSEKGIPSDYTPHENFFSSYEIQTIHSLIKAIDNPSDDVALVSVLTSPIFAFDATDLLNIRRATDAADMYFSVRDYNGNDVRLKQKCKNVVEKLKKWRKKSRSVPSHTLIWWLYVQTHFMSFAGKLTNGDERKDNLLTFYELAEKYEQREMKGITKFIAYLESFINSKNRLGKKEEGANSVRLMTIHDSKGLEFPVCFYISPGSQISRADERKKVIVSEVFGPAFAIPTGKLGGKTYTYAEKAAIAETRSDVMDEELRLLYVALTRAKNQLIISANTEISSFRTYLELASMSKTSFSYYLKNALTMLKVIGLGLYNTPTFRKALDTYEENDICVSDNNLTVKIYHEYIPSEEMYDAESEKSENKSTILNDEDILLALSPIGNPLLTETPFKISVSSIREGLLDEGSAATVSSVKKYPEFAAINKENISAFTGTAMHVFMQFCDFENCVKNGTQNEAERLVQRGFITEMQKNVLNHLTLTAFFTSNTYKGICSAKRVEREKRYTLLLPSSRFYSEENRKDKLDELNKKTLIQGVIDCYCINCDDTVTLIDFKTDSVSEKSGEAVLKERHGNQMQLYKEAVEEIEGKKVSKAIIYSFCLSKEIEI